MAGLLEICCYSVEDARLAQAAGADRIELCAGEPEGGTTPSVGVLEQARNAIGIPVFPMVRPRGGDFDYGPDEFAAMCRDVQAVAELGFPGVVLGVLTAAGRVDQTRTAALIRHAAEFDPAIEVTFHRAFDVVIDPAEAYRELTDIGVSRILTSGQATTALDGRAVLTALIDQPGTGPLILAGGGVRPGNARDLLEAGVTELHSSASARPGAGVDPDTVSQLATIVHS